MEAAELKPLTYKEKLFGDFFCTNGFIQWRAAESAGYQGSKETLYVRGSENLKKPNVRAYIDTKLDEMTLDVEQSIAEVSNIAKGEAAYYLNEDGSIDMEGLKESGLIRNIHTISTRTRHHQDDSTTEHRTVKLLNRRQALQDLLKVHDKIKPKSVKVVIGFEDAMLKAYGTEDEKDAHS